MGDYNISKYSEYISDTSPILIDLAEKIAKDSNNGELPDDFIYLWEEEGSEMLNPKYTMPSVFGIASENALGIYLEEEFGLESGTSKVEPLLMFKELFSLSDEDYNFMITAVNELVPINTLEIKEGITKINGLDNLVYGGSLILPSTVVDLNLGVLNYVSELTLNEGLQQITRNGLQSFYGEHLTIPSTVTSIRVGYRMKNLKTVKVLGDSTRFDNNWSELFGSATKVTD